MEVILEVMSFRVFDRCGRHRVRVGESVLVAIGTHARFGEHGFVGTLSQGRGRGDVKMRSITCVWSIGRLVDFGVFLVDSWMCLRKSCFCGHDFGHAEFSN